MLATRRINACRMGALCNIAWKLGAINMKLGAMNIRPRIYGLSLHDHHPGDCDDPDAVVFSATKPSELISISGLTACEMSCARSYCNGVVDISGRQHIPCPKACTSV